MYKHFLSFAVLALCTLSAFANVITGVAAIPDGYYDGVSGKKSADAILSALNTCISRNYNEISYKGLEPHYLKTDFYADTLWDVYSTCRFTYEDANNPQKYVCDGWNKEHVCCQSWLGSGPMVSDMFNVYPTDARVNNLRSNYPYGVVGTNKGISNDPDKHALGKLGSSSKTGYSGTCYEPDDRYKGDLARTFFYMVARYRNNTLNSGEGSAMFKSSPTDLTDYSLSFLLEWHRNDPVSQKEIDRNQAVYGEQNNRNPFIDYPELVEYIWGNKKGETVDLSAMTPTCENQTPVSDKKYGVTWSMYGRVIRVDSVYENTKPSSIPDEPNTIEVLCVGHETFMGWSSTPLSAPTDIAPVLYTKKEDFPAVTADITYYAVFAHGESEQGAGPVTATQNFSSYSRGNAVTSESIGNVTVTFNKAGASNAATYYTEVRCYAKSTIAFSGAQMSRIEFTAGANDKGNQLTPNTGTMSSGNIWTGNTSSVTFTVGGDKGYRGIGAITVTYEDNTVVYHFSAYANTCDDSQALENNNVPNTNRKVLINNQLYILVGEHIYSITGQKIQ